ncbi:hypothetical protein RFM68_30870 [Mesorhizobium sp. MSK_1335]|uniref:Uncharacterized protein n=1 Tax=Mesorhizobium montanum TaxID=3072323 RepID=A0ABU4ZXX0_9HYPH|nr:hypothetical protein [Mesorhizobium sp. MSK_1335]MDX8528883.1 hypothetical protein [Mesorhizobium sp. MSK_1335]
MNLGDAKDSPISIVVMQNFALLGKLIFWIRIIQAMDGVPNSPEADSELFVCDRRRVGIAAQHHRNTHFEGRRSQIAFFLYIVMC